MKDSPKILDTRWWSPRHPLGPSLICIGIVAFESYSDGSWKAYIGYGQGEDEGDDCLTIYTHGVPIGSKEAACILFPQLDPEKFKY